MEQQEIDKKTEMPIAGPNFSVGLCAKTTLIYVDGSKTAFVCEVCGSNCFRKFKDILRYKCNSCGETYSGT
jgi:hypothetical protein